MSDTTIHPTGVVSAPGDYVIPQAAELLLKGAFARFDGSGAAGSFQPLLRVISDAGKVALESAADTTVAAGASADASWFPHIAAAAAAAPAGTGLSWAYIDGTVATSCPGPGTTLLTANLLRFYTNAPSLFGTGTDGSGNVGMTILANGHYFSLITVGPFGTPAAGSVYEVFSTGGGDVAGLEMAPAALVFPAGGITDVGYVQAGEIMTVGGGTSPPTAPIIAEIDNSGASTVRMQLHGHMLIQLDSDPTELH